MKVGIVTITELDNFGNRLQNYALQEVLKELGCEVETIPNYIVYGYRRSRKYQIREFIHAVRVKNRKMISEIKKQWRFERFDKKHFRFSKCYSTIDYISPELNEYYDCFVAGSDQIWNPYFTFNFDFNFLCFASPEKRISYSASFGADNVPKEKIELFSDYLQGMRAISVREYAGQQIVKDLIGKTVPVLVDPTLLFSKDRWRQIEQKPKWISNKDKYILTYYLGDTNERETLLNTIYSDYPEFKDYKVIDIYDYKQTKKYAINPAEFIYLIRNAQLMITDSFHGTVFSIIMKVPYVPVKREGKDISMISRLETLNKLLDLNVDELIIKKHINDNGYITRILQEKYQESINYLRQSLNL